MALPNDVVSYILGSFNPNDARLALASLESAVDHAGNPANDRLLRCVAVGARNELKNLLYLVELLKTDYRDVIVAGEYDSVDGKLCHIRDLNQPISNV